MATVHFDLKIHCTHIFKINSYFFIFSDIESIKVLLDHLKHDDHFITDTGDTFLHWLVRQELVQAVHEIVDTCCNVDVENAFSETPLHVAVEIGSLFLVKFLLDRGACVNAINGRGDTPMHIATYSHSKNKNLIIEVLLRFNPDLNIKNNSLSTPLMIVCANLNIDHKLVHLLILAGAEVDVSPSGWMSEFLKRHLITAWAVNRYDRVVEVIYLYMLCKRSEGVELEVSEIFTSINEFNKGITWELYIQLELMKLQEVKLADSSITMWDIAVAPLDKVVQIFKNRRILTAAVNSPFKLYNVLDSMLINKILFATRKIYFIEACLPYLQTVLNSPLPLECLECIMEHLDERTIQNMLVCYIQTTGNPVSFNDLFDSPRFLPALLDD